MNPSGGSWPHRVLLAAARRELPPSLLGGASEDEWEPLASVASAHGMEGWLARELRGAAGVPRAFQIQLQAAAARVAGNHLHRMRDARLTLDALGGAAVPAMILKGPALVERYYGDPSVRTYGDIDVYVEARSLRTAIAALEAAGLKLVDRNWPLLVADLRGQLHFLAPGGGMVELHWHLVNGSRQRSTLGMDPDEMWDAVVPGTLGQTPCLRLPAGEEIAHLCLHAAMHGCNRLVWLLDLAMIAASSEVDWDRTALRLERWGFGAGGYLVLSVAHALVGARVPLDHLRPLRPGAVTMAGHRRLLARWDLSEPERTSRVRELFLATAGDGARRRLKLAYDIVVPPRSHTDGGKRNPLRTVRRVTVGTAARVAGKLGAHGEDHTGVEYSEVGDQAEGRERFVAAVSSLGRRAPARPHVIVLSPSRTVGMSHYARALADDVSASATVTLIDAANEHGAAGLHRRLAEATRDPDAFLLVTSPHWSVPALLQGAPRGGGFVFHDPILDAATPWTRPLHVLYYRLLARRLGTVILHGEGFVENILKLGLHARSVIVVPHGFVPDDLEVTSPYDPRGPLAFLGRFHPYKGLGVFADSLRLLDRRGLEVPVLAAGTGLPPEALPRLPTVTLHAGELSDADFRHAVARCSAVVLPYERANQSGVLATAFRAGRPAIASAVGSFPEYVREGVNGMLVPPGDPVALADAIERFWSDPAEACRLAEGARRTWDEMLSPKRAAERIVTCLVAARAR